MCVVNRAGVREPVMFDTIVSRLRSIGDAALLRINYPQLVVKVIEQMYDGINTSQIDELTAQQCASMVTTHLDYGLLAGGIVVSNLHKNTTANFLATMTKLYEFTDISGKSSPLISKELFDTAVANERVIESHIQYIRDYDIDYFGMKTLERAYLMQTNGTIVERPQHMWMRVSLGIHGTDLDAAFETYERMSQKFFTHATPTLFNAGTPRPQLSSCYLLGMEDDSIDGIYNTLHDCGKISKWAGGIGLHIHNIRGTGSHIRGTNGTSNGIVPMLRVFNMTARYVDQCFDLDTFIHSKQGIRRIGDVVIGDEIYNSKGGLDRVAETHYSKYIGRMIDLDSAVQMKPILVTAEHPFLIIRRGIDDTNDCLERGITNRTIFPEYVAASQITTDDVILSPTYNRPLTSVDPTDGIVSVLTDLDLYIVGLIISCGEIDPVTMDTTVRYRENEDHHITERCNEHAKCNMIRFDFSATVDTNRSSFKFNFTPQVPISRSMIYSQGNVKHINPIFFSLTRARTDHLLRGLRDGYAQKIGGTDIGVIDRDHEHERHRVAAVDVPLELAANIAHLVQRTSRTYRVIRHTFAFSIVCENDLNELPVERKYIYTRPTAIRVIESGERVVVDLRMADATEPSYVTEIGAVHNGGGKRNGSFAIYIEPWHPDIEAFLELKKNHGDEEQRARDLFYALWTPDLFMGRVKRDEQWSLFCPDKCPGLADAHGDAFNTLYCYYEERGMATKTISARALWYQVLDCQMETGTPYLLFKDAANEKSNQKNLGTIKSSNLCTEIIEYSDEKESAVCNLASISLPKCIKTVAKSCGTNDRTTDRTTDGGPNIQPTNILEYIDIVVYTKSGCRYCTLAKRFLRDAGIVYTEKFVDDKDERETLYAELTKEWCDPTDPTDCIRTMPMIFANRVSGRANATNATNITIDTIDAIIWRGYDKMREAYTQTFDHTILHEITGTITRNLNRIIDVNFYPTSKTKRSNLCHRPIGIGVQGLADTFAILGMPFESKEARALNIEIFETIYHASMKRSNELAVERHESMNSLHESFVREEWRFASAERECNEYIVNESYVTCDETRERLARMKPIQYEIHQLGGRSMSGAYSSFIGSPLHRGKFQFDLWNRDPSARYDWNALRTNVMRFGTRNSLLVAPMPTASTSQIMGNNEACEPFTNNIYTRRTIAGEFVVVNRHLMKELDELDLWNEEMKDAIIYAEGSVQSIRAIPAHVREKYKIVWEMSMKSVIDMSADRGAFVCQSQSMNLWVEEPNYKNLTAMHFHSHSVGLKTGLYYLRRKPKARPQQFTIVPQERHSVRKMSGDETCDMCSG